MLSVLIRNEKDDYSGEQISYLEEREEVLLLRKSLLSFEILFASPEIPFSYSTNLTNFGPVKTLPDLVMILAEAYLKLFEICLIRFQESF